jgi:membrane-bound ClpP family serine protease
VFTLGVALLVLGALLAVAEAHVVSHGILGGAAIVALAGGVSLSVVGAVRGSRSASPLVWLGCWPRAGHPLAVARPG